MLYFKNKLGWILGVFLLASCNGINPVIRPPAGICKYVDQSPEYLGNLVKICSIRYTKASLACINHLTDHYSKNNMPPVIERYIELWNENFDKLIRKSSVTFYQGEQPDKAQLLSKKINMSVTNKITREKFSLGNINYLLTPAGFSYDKGQAYPNFANQYWGGGVLHGANVQEEIKMRQSNALIWIAQANNASQNYAEWCPAININNLNINPVVMKLSIFINFDNAEGYGSKLHGYDKEKQKALMTPKDNAEHIYSYAMAATSFSRGDFYKRSDLDEMFYVATTAFYYTMLAMDHDGKALEIHTGNWGAGAFNNSLKMGWAIQLFAIKAAYELFKTKTQKEPGVKYFYDANSAPSTKKLIEAYGQIRAHLKDDISADEYLETLLNLASTDDSWQVQK